VFRGRAQGGGVSEWGAECGVWVREGEITGYWRKLHNEELHNLHAPPYIVRVIILRRMRWVAHVVRMGRRNSYSVLMGKPERNRSLGRSLHRLEDTIKMDLKNNTGGRGLD
jgi:hypothetical protein